MRIQNIIALRHSGAFVRIRQALPSDPNNTKQAASHVALVGFKLGLVALSFLLTTLTVLRYGHSLLHPDHDTMDDVAVEDEKKPFDAETGANDEDSQPDPDESLLMESGNGRVWLVKVHHTLPLSSILSHV